MVSMSPIHISARDYLSIQQPDEPVHFCAPSVLTAKARTFLDGFPGLVTFAVKSNPDPATLAHLLSAGIRGFDVASPREIDAVRRLCPDCAQHYNNPVRGKAEIAFAVEAGIRSFSIDDPDELEKLATQVPCDSTEISVRFKLPVKGAAYDFGAKFGAAPDLAAQLLRRAHALGFRPSLTFHPGTQCEDPSAYATYIETAYQIACAAGVMIHRLNVGGGFPNTRLGPQIDLQPFFDAITRAITVFPAPPKLVCEPGRGLVGDAFALGVRVKSVRAGGVYLNDGVYGGLSEFPSMGLSAFRVFAPDGTEKTERSARATLFGPTCDSIDTLPGPVDIPADMAEDDYILFSSMGAYVTGVSTEFNGYGPRQTVLVKSL